jgi:hypothetical protein
MGIGDRWCGSEEWKVYGVRRTGIQAGLLIRIYRTTAKNMMNKKEKKMLRSTVNLPRVAIFLKAVFIDSVF